VLIKFLIYNEYHLFFSKYSRNVNKIANNSYSILKGIYMFSHIMIGANDIQASKVFYDAILGELGHSPGVIDEKGRCFYFAGDNIFALTTPINGEPSSHGNGTTIGFSVTSTEQADAWHAAGIANGGVNCEDLPGVREMGGGQLYLAYLLDPSGNKICALHRIS
jgi:catechol 2,3-dioxygenase-like lactoylglutathione lyase family enzyme